MTPLEAVILNIENLERCNINSDNIKDLKYDAPLISADNLKGMPQDKIDYLIDKYKGKHQYTMYAPDNHNTLVLIHLDEL